MNLALGIGSLGYVVDGQTLSESLLVSITSGETITTIVEGN